MQEQKTPILSPPITTIPLLSKTSKNLNLLQISEKGEVKLNSTEAIDPDVIQQILDYSHLRAKSYELTQTQIERANNQQTLIIGFMLTLVLFTTTFTLSRFFKVQVIKAQTNVISITV